MYLSIYLSVCLFIYLSIYLANYLTVYLTSYLLSRPNDIGTATRHSAVAPSEKTHSVVFNGCKEDGETGNRLSESILSKCCGPSAARKDTLALACSRSQKRHSRLSKNILRVLCAFDSRHLLCKGLQRWSLPAHCLFHVSSLPLRSFKPSGDIHH